MVHEIFSLEKITKLKIRHPEAKLIAHPECEEPILKIADYIGSTTGLLKYTKTDAAKEYIVATETGILHQMMKSSPEKTFIPAPPEDSTCACNECNFMRLNTLEKLYNTLKYEWPEVNVDEAIAQEAIKPIQKMLEISAKLGL
jgi:quinolinate synthase